MKLKLELVSEEDLSIINLFAVEFPARHLGSSLQPLVDFLFMFFPGLETIPLCDVVSDSLADQFSKGLSFRHTLHHHTRLGYEPPSMRKDCMEHFVRQFPGRRVLLAGVIGTD